MLNQTRKEGTVQEMPSSVHNDGNHSNHKKVSFGGPGLDTTSITKKNKTRQPFFYKGARVLSVWGRYGTVRKVFKEKEKVIVMVAYYARDIPKTWEIGGVHVPSRPSQIDPSSIIVIGHDSRSLKLETI